MDSTETVLKQLILVRRQAARLQRSVEKLNSLRTVFYFSVPFKITDLLSSVQKDLCDLQKRVEDWQKRGILTERVKALV